MATAHSHIHSSIPSHSNPQPKPAPQPLSNVNKSSVSSTDASSNLNTVDEPSSVPHDSREKTCSATLNTEELQSDKQPTADSSDHKLDDTAHTDSKDTGDATVEHATHKESDDEGYVYDYNEDEKTLKVSYPWKPDQTVPVFYLVTSRITDHCESSFSSFGYKTRAALSSTRTIPGLWCLSSSLVSSTYSTNTTTPTNALKLSLYRVCFLASLILPLVPNCDVTNVFQMPDVLTSSANTSSTEHERMIATSVLTLFIACIALRMRLIGNKMCLILLLSLRFTTKFALFITSGGYYSCALEFNVIKCWGDNTDGELGFGDTNNRGDQPNQMGDNLLAIDLGSTFIPAEISAGERHTCSCSLLAINLGSSFIPMEITASQHICTVSTSNKVKCWARNGNGQLGLGDTNNRGDEANEMGDNLPEIDLGSFTAFTHKPTFAPTDNPTPFPSLMPTFAPMDPTPSPSVYPIAAPTVSQTTVPTTYPTKESDEPTRNAISTTDQTKYSSFRPTIMVTVSSKPSISIEVEDTYGDNHDIDVTAKETEATKENESSHSSVDIVPLVLAVAVAVLIGAALLVRYCFHIERRKRMQESQNMVGKELQQGVKAIIDEHERMDNEKDSTDQVQSVYNAKTVMKGSILITNGNGNDIKQVRLDKIPIALTVSTSTGGPATDKVLEEIEGHRENNVDTSNDNKVEMEYTDEGPKNIENRDVKKKATMGASSNERNEGIVTKQTSKGDAIDNV